MNNQEISRKLAVARIHQNELVELILKEGKVITLEKDVEIIREGSHIKSLSIVLDGEVRVWKNSPDGRQVLLYYVSPVQTCVMSLAATFRDKMSIIEARTTQRSSILVLPIWGLEKWMKYDNWRTFVLFSFIESYDDIVQLYSEVVFKKLDRRIISFFKNYTERKQTRFIELSHEQIAREMGTSREVISRILKNLEQDNKLKLGLKNIELLI